MKTTFEIQNSNHILDRKAILEKLYTLKSIWNVHVDQNNGLVSFEYLHDDELEIVRKELIEMGYFVVNDTHHFNKNTKP